MKISIIKVKQNEIAFLGNTFPIEISIAMKEAMGDETVLTVWNHQKKIFSEPISITKNDDYCKVKILIEASEVGLQKYNIITSQVDGEENLNNMTHPLIK